MSLITLLTAFLFIRSSIAGYVLEDDYNPSNFFSMFSFFTGPDPTNGFVNYVDQSTAQSGGLVKTSSGSVYMGVDSTNQAPSGRSSVRLTSNKSYGTGSLVILDLAHMPGGICGTWPAFWMVGPDWPYGGEIDIIEGVNDQTTNDMTLHTSPGCSISDNGAFSGTINTDNCDINAPGQSTNAGCQIDTTNTGTYGSGFNSAGGGVYAMDWTSSSISIYFFARGSIPSDISSGNPNPSGWGKPLSQFQGACNFPTFFQNQSIVFDTTFCGDWAGNTWSSSSCASSAGTCNDFVANNPSAFVNAFWTINSLQVYQQGSSSNDNAVSTIATVAKSVVSVAAATGSPVVVATTTNKQAAAPASTKAASSAAADNVSAWDGGAVASVAASTADAGITIEGADGTAKAITPTTKAAAAATTTVDAGITINGADGSAVALTVAAASTAAAGTTIEGADGTAIALNGAAASTGSSGSAVIVGQNGQVLQGHGDGVPAGKAHEPSVTISIQGATGTAVTITSFVATAATTMRVSGTTIDIPLNAYVMINGLVGEDTEQKRSAAPQITQAAKRSSEDSSKVARDARISEEPETQLENENIRRMRHVRHINSHRRGGLWMH